MKLKRGDMVAHIEPGAVDRDLSGVFLGECHEVGDVLELAVLGNDEDGRVRAPVAERFKGIYVNFVLFMMDWAMKWGML